MLGLEELNAAKAKLEELNAAKAKLETEIRSAKAKFDAEATVARHEAADSILAWMVSAGVTITDLHARAGGHVGRTGKRPIKYRDAAGNTWAGVGQRPRWLRAAMLAGAELESFRVAKAK